MVANGNGLTQSGVMRTWRVVFFAAAVAAVAASCGRPEAAGPAPVPAGAANEPRAAQPKLPTLKLWLGAAELNAEVALSALQTQTGMMFRTNMAENEAMLFVFGGPHRAAFWMKNTYVPLSAAYIDPEGVILEIHDLEPLNTNAVSAASSEVQYVLETPRGWFSRHNVGVGTVVRTERGSLRETFFNQRR